MRVQNNIGYFVILRIITSFTTYILYCSRTHFVLLNSLIDMLIHAEVTIQSGTIGPQTRRAQPSMVSVACAERD